MIIMTMLMMITMMMIIMMTMMMITTIMMTMMMMMMMMTMTTTTFIVDYDADDYGDNAMMITTMMVMTMITSYLSGRSQFVRLGPSRSSTSACQLAFPKGRSSDQSSSPAIFHLSHP